MQVFLPACPSRRIILRRVRELAGESDGVEGTRGDGVLDLVDGTIKVTIAVDQNVLRILLSALVIGVGVEGSDVFVGESEGPVARFTGLGLHLFEHERKGTLNVVGLPGDGDT